MISEKKIRARLKRFHHDIKYVDGQFIEDAVKEYQKSKDEELLIKIINNFSIFRKTWGRQFAPYCDNDIEAGEYMHDEIVWRSVEKFEMGEALKGKGYAFNAYLVSTLMNQLKNHFNARQSHKNHPRIMCPICSENVYQIDGKHLRHVIDLERYRRMHPRFPLVSSDGRVSCPLNGKPVEKISEPYLNRVNGTYTVEDFKEEFAHLYPVYPFECPATLMPIWNITAEYPSIIRDGYTEAEFLEDYPEFEGAICCPFSGKKMLEMTQDHLDTVLKQKTEKPRFSMRKFRQLFPTATMKAQQVDVKNPYTKKIVPEITLEMLREAGTTFQAHLEEHATCFLDEWYPNFILCPFTGRRTHKMTKEDLTEIGRTSVEFYMAVCKYPLRKWQVKCGCCDKFVDNIWTHLEQAEHTFSKAMTMEEYERSYGSANTRAIVSTNSFVNNEQGESIHLADLFAKKVKQVDPLEIEDSLSKAAEDDLDRRIAAVVRTSRTLEDVCHEASERRKVNLPFEFQPGKSRALREVIKRITGVEDFDFVDPPEEGSKKVEILTPGIDTIRMRLIRLIECSDLIEIVTPKAESEHSV